MLHIKTFTFNPFLENTYILYDDDKNAAIVDPGCYEDFEKKELVDFVQTEGLKVEKLLNTHCHIDHVFGNAFVKQKFNVSLFVHPKDEETLRAVKTYAPAYGFNHFDEAAVDEYLEEGMELLVGKEKLDVVFVPGHAPGHVAFIHPDSKSIIGGDVLFDGSIGRTDLPGGDFDTLIKSIHDKFFNLPEDYTVYPGHGGTTTIGKEMKTNPFCAVA